MNHADKMTFGIHSDKAMGDVPAEYLDYISGQAWLVKWPDVKKYIEDNRQKLDKMLDEEGLIPLRFRKKGTPENSIELDPDGHAAFLNESHTDYEGRES